MMIKIIMMMIMWQIWWWWECDSDWCLPPVTPGLCQPPELGPGSWGCPGPAWLWLLRLGPVSAGPESAVHPVSPHQSSPASHLSDLSDPGSCVIWSVSSWSQECQEDTSSVILTPDPGCRVQKPALALAGFWNYSISWIMVKTWTFWRGQLENFPDSNPFSQYYSNILLAFCLSILQVNFPEI